MYVCENNSWREWCHKPGKGTKRLEREKGVEKQCNIFKLKYKNLSLRDYVEKDILSFIVLDV